MGKKTLFYRQWYDLLRTFSSKVGILKRVIIFVCVWVFFFFFFFFFFFHVNKFSEKVYLPCGAFYIGSLAWLSENIAQRKMQKKKKKKKTKNVLFE